MRRLLELCVKFFQTDTTSYHTRALEKYLGESEDLADLERRQRAWDHLPPNYRDRYY